MRVNKFGQRTYKLTLKERIKTQAWTALLVGVPFVVIVGLATGASFVGVAIGWLLGGSIMTHFLWLKDDRPVEVEPVVETPAEDTPQWENY